MRRSIVLLATAALALSLSGCGGEAPNANQADVRTPATEVREDAIKIEDIEWTVGQEVIDGNRAIVFSYVNNSDYVICGMQAEFRQREDVTDDDRSVFDTFYQENDTWEEINGGPEEMYIGASNLKIVDVGEQSDPLVCRFNFTAWPVETMEQYELMEPNLFTIAFIADGK